jgi:hypothetical protein
MNLDQVNKWLTLVANVGVVVSIGLVAFQLKQNTDAIRVQSAYDLYATSTTADVACVGDNMSEAMVRGFLRPTELTDAQITQLFCWIDINVNMAMNAWIAVREGRTSSEEWEDAKQFLVAILDYDVGRVLWQSYNEWGALDPSFRKEIDAALAQSDKKSTRVWRTMIEGVRTLGRDQSLEDAISPTDNEGAAGSKSAIH